MKYVFVLIIIFILFFSGCIRSVNTPERKALYMALEETCETLEIPEYHLVSFEQKIGESYTTKKYTVFFDEYNFGDNWELIKAERYDCETMQYFGTDIEANVKAICSGIVCLQKINSPEGEVSQPKEKLCISTHWDITNSNEATEKYDGPLLPNLEKLNGFQVDSVKLVENAELLGIDCEPTLDDLRQLR